MDVIFPSYLKDAGFEYRHVKIRIIQSALKMDSPEGAWEKIKEQSNKFGNLLGQALLALESNSIEQVQKDSNKKIREFEQVLKGDIDILHTLTLPLPNTLVDSVAHEWSAETGVIGSVIEGLAGSGSIPNKVLGSGTNMTNIRKPLADPGYFQSYAGTQPRNFTLSFDLIPNNNEDAGNMFLILHVLKKYSSPSTAIASAVILAPHFFQIEFRNPYINTLINSSDVVLKDMSIDYGADGFMQQTPDGIPKHIKLDLTFAERHMMTAEMY